MAKGLWPGLTMHPEGMFLHGSKLSESPWKASAPLGQG